MSFSLSDKSIIVMNKLNVIVGVLFLGVVTVSQMYTPASKPKHTTDEQVEEVANIYVEMNEDFTDPTPVDSVAASIIESEPDVSTPVETEDKFQNYLVENSEVEPVGWQEAEDFLYMLEADQSLITNEDSEFRNQTLSEISRISNGLSAEESSKFKNRVMALIAANLALPDEDDEDFVDPFKGEEL